MPTFIIAGLGVLGDAAAVGEEIASAVEPVPIRRRQVVEVDVLAGDDVLLHRPGRDDLRRNAAGQSGAADLDQLARMRVGRQSEHHRDAPVVVERGAEDAAAAARRRVVVLDVVEQERLAGAGTLRQPHDGAELDVPIDLGVDLLQLAVRLRAPRSSRADRRTRSGLRSTDMCSFRAWNIVRPRRDWQRVGLGSRVGQIVLARRGMFRSRSAYGR